MTHSFLYATDNAGPLLTFDGEYRMRRHRTLGMRRQTARIARAITARLPRVRHTALTR